MASLRRVQLRSEMGIFCILLCMSYILQEVSSQGPGNGPIGDDNNRFNIPNKPGQRDPRVYGVAPANGGLPPAAAGGGDGGRQPLPKKVDPNFNADSANRHGNINGVPDRNGDRGQHGMPNQPPEYRRQHPISPDANHGTGKSHKKSRSGLGLGRKLPQIKIAEHPACSSDAKQLCSSNSLPNNFAVLDCLQSDSRRDVTKECQHFLWQYKKNLTTDVRFDAAASEVCKDALEELTDCRNVEQGTGHRISCLIEHKSNITNASCKQFLTKMASIVFSDYRLVYKFTDACQGDIEKINCGRIDRDDGTDGQHSQGQTISCLSEHHQSLDSKCKHEIVRIAELQADDYHMDRPLFYACRDDREHFCPRTKAGAGKVYKCLYRHKFDREMSSACREKLVVRQSLTQDNYKVNKAFTDACRQDIREHGCLIHGKSEFRQAKLSNVLLCLEGKMKDGGHVTPECIGELKEIRRSLMEDFKISPGIVVDCASEIKEHCHGGLHREGKTLHCLMDLVRDRKRKSRLSPVSINAKCRRALEELLREADAGEDYSMDPALQKACQPVVDTACNNIKSGDARIMNCLMEKVGTTTMNEECEERLMEIQYFIARDFKMDSRLYKYCHKDAVSFCHADQNWADVQGPSPHPIVFSCLYRHNKLYPADPEKQLSRPCAFEVKRIMRQRSLSVELEPRIEEPCLTSLGRFCSERTGKGDEIACLRENVKQLDKECLWAIGNFTEDVEKDPTIDRILMRACTPMIKSFCSGLMDNENAEPSEIMECLIKHKHSAEMNRKCAVGIEHHQLITMQDIRFSFRFKEVCKGDVYKFCGNIHKKSEVIACLSSIHRNDTLMDQPLRLGRPCRKQLRFELFQRSESIKLDPSLEEDCAVDRDKFCRNVVPGNSAVVECLKKHRTNLTSKCRARLFKRETIEAIDNSVDFILMTSCKSMIKQYCPDYDVKDVYSCLLKHKSEMEFDHKCRRVVKERQFTRFRDYRLNPELAKDCKLDIVKFCKDVLPTGNEQSHVIEGRVISCLKKGFAAGRLTTSCEDHIKGFIKEAALNYKDDPVLARQCQHEIKELCLDRAGDDDDERGQVEECLKLKLTEGKITNPKCKMQVLRLLNESRADIQVDPLLHRACALDLKHYCFDVIQGQGRHMSCLLSSLEDKTVKLNRECRKMLMDRVTMWEYAARVAPPESFREIISQVQASKSRNYFLGIILGILCVIFFGGLFCGRVTKRVAAEVKNK